MPSLIKVYPCNKIVTINARLFFPLFFVWIRYIKKTCAALWHTCLLRKLVKRYTTYIWIEVFRFTITQEIHITGVAVNCIYLTFKQQNIWHSHNLKVIRGCFFHKFRAYRWSVLFNHSCLCEWLVTTRMVLHQLNLKLTLHTDSLCENYQDISDWFCKKLFACKFNTIYKSLVT